VIEVLRGEKPIAQICREREVTDSWVYKWRGEFLDKALEPVMNYETNAIR
jgi:hypothetical protein